VAPWEIHPALVHFPVALLFASFCVDSFAFYRQREGWARVGTGLLWGGVWTGLVAAPAGLLAAYTAPMQAAGLEGLLYGHFAFVAASMALFISIALVRWRRPAPLPPRWQLAVGALATVLLLAGGMLGGTLVYRGGTGVKVIDGQPPSVSDVSRTR
jgi:uncharacterized membrane protein